MALARQAAVDSLAYVPRVETATSLSFSGFCPRSASRGRGLRARPARRVNMRTLCTTSMIPTCERSSKPIRGCCWTGASHPHRRMAEVSAFLGYRTPRRRRRLHSRAVHSHWIGAAGESPTHSGAGRIVTLRMWTMTLSELWQRSSVSLRSFLSGDRPPLDAVSDAVLDDYAEAIRRRRVPRMALSRGTGEKAARRRLPAPHR